MNIADEQAKDPEIALLIRQLQLGQAKKSAGDKHILIDDALLFNEC